MIEITWSITSVEGDSNNGVVNVNWLAVGNLDGHKEAEKGTAEFKPDPSKEGYTPLEELTNEIVLGWIEGKKPKAEETIKSFYQSQDVLTSINL